MKVTKNKLIEALKLLGRFPAKSMKKYELMEMLNNMYNENIDELIFIINNEIYDILKRLVKADDKGIGIYREYEKEVYFLEEILAIDEPIIDEEKIYIKFSEGMKEKFAKFINKKNEKKVNVTHIITDTIINIVDVYGVVEDYEVFNMLNNLLNFEVDLDLMYMLMFNQIDLLDEVVMINYEGERYFVSRVVDYPEEIIEVRKTRDLYYKSYTLNELEERKICNLINCKEAKEIIDFMEKRKIKYSIEIISNMIFMIMNMPQSNIDELKKLINIDLNDVDEVNEYLQLILNLHNNIPHYVLYGYSPNELFKIELKERQNEQELKKKQKVGRNDPCPCGSGRKYKHCCLNKVIKVDFRDIQYDDCVKKEEGMNFFVLRNFLFHYTNQKFNINNDLENIKDIFDAEPEEMIEIREKLWSDKNIIIEYILKNPDNLDNENISRIRNWNENKIKKDFILYKYDKEYTILMDGNYIYYVKGLKESIRNMIPENILPIFVDTVLLPLNDKIIYDSYINRFNVSFGKEFKAECDRNFKILLKQNKVKYKL